MALNIASMLHQTLTYWAPSTPDGFGGRSFAAPVQLRGRWEDKQELFVNPTGEEVLSHSKAFTLVDLELTGYLFLGISVATNPQSVDGAREIRQTKNIPSVDADEFLKVSWL